MVNPGKIGTRAPLMQVWCAAFSVLILRLLPTQPLPARPWPGCPKRWRSR